MSDLNRAETRFPEALPLLEMICLFVLIIGLCIGVFIAFTTPDSFDVGIAAEDGPLEWISAIALLIAALALLRRIWVRPDRSGLFIAVSVFGAMILFFGAGEEISWGQRVFGWQSGEFFQENNAQSETNIHNLMVGETKINRVVFGTLLSLVFIFYFCALPFLAHGTSRLARLVKTLFVPVPRLRHGALFAVSLIVMLSLSQSRAPELGEFALALLLAAAVFNPSPQIGVAKDNKE